jgi:molybdopterin-guanine dinucleotide biosynthesis protein A
MGRDKALLPFGGYPTLAEYQYRRLLLLFDQVSLSAKEDKFPFDAPVIPDRHEASSPIVALASVLETMNSEWIFVLSVDMPNVDALLIAQLYAGRDTHPQAHAVIATSSTGCEPLCALYHRDLLPVVLRQLDEDNHRMRSLIATVPSIEIHCARDGVFANLNTPEEYARLLSKKGTHHAN